MRCHKLVLFSVTLLILFAMHVVLIFAGEDLSKLATKCADGKQKECAKLQEIAKSHSDARVRAEAASLITDQNILSSIAGTDNDEAVRAAATKKLTDQQLLGKIAISDASSDVRMTAMNRLTQQATLKRVFDNAGDPRVRDEAKRRLDDIEHAKTLTGSWILSKGSPLYGVDPGIGVEVLEFFLDGSLGVQVQGILVMKLRSRFLSENTLSIEEGTEGIISAQTLTLRNSRQEGIYVRARRCSGSAVTVRLSGGAIWRTPVQYCPIEDVRNPNQ